MEPAARAGGLGQGLARVLGGADIDDGPAGAKVRREAPWGSHAAKVAGPIRPVTPSFTLA